MRLKCVALAVAMLASAPRAMLPQVGTLDERTQFAVVTGQGNSTTHGPLLAIVLWRGEPRWMNSDHVIDLVHPDSAFRNARRRADDADLSLFGNGKAYALTDREYHRLIVEGKEFILAPSDSTLVVMVSIPREQGPRSVTTARISSKLPSDYWGKTWFHGDTTFTVRAHFDRMQSMLLEALRRSPTVANFLR